MKAGRSRQSEFVRALQHPPAADRNTLLLAGADSEASRYARFADQLTKQLLGAAFDCPTAARAHQFAQDSLQASGLRGWTISDSGGCDAERPCASLAIDSDTRTVTIAPVSR